MISKTSGRFTAKLNLFNFCKGSKIIVCNLKPTPGILKNIKPIQYDWKFL